MSRPILGKKKKNVVNLSSAELSQRVVKVKVPITISTDGILFYFLFFFVCFVLFCFSG